MTCIRWMAAIAATAILTACSGEAAKPAAEAPAEPIREEIIAHGKYIVEGVGMCGDCHTPMLPDGSYDATRSLAGAPTPGAPPPPGVPFALISVAIAGLPDGYTEESLATFLMNGTPGDGSPPLPPMPHYRMNAADARATAAYLATLPKPTPAAPPT